LTTTLEPSLTQQSSPTTSLPSVKITPLFLLTITALAALFRFAYLDRPPFWNDEARTYMRICGTYDQMLQLLRTDGFGPLHYEIDWLLAQRFHMTPFMMRLSPAITGTLMVPAICMLAFELLGHRVARMTAILTACSAFFMAYSRDGKMYMPLWFFITLHLACLLWWMRTGRLTAWLLFVAAGCIAVGIHVTGSVVFGLDLLIGLTAANLTWQKSVLLLLGILLIASGPIGYTAKFNQMSQQLDQNGWGATGIDWVSARTDGHDGAALTADSASSYLFAFSWLDEPKVRVMVPTKIMAAGATLLSILAAALACALIPWRPNQPRQTDAVSHLQTWRAALWLTVWLLLPVYAFFRATVPEAATWTDWRQSLFQIVTNLHLYILLILGFALAAVLAQFRQIRPFLAALAAALLIWSVMVPVINAVLLDMFSTVPPPTWLRLPMMVPITAMILLPVIAWTGSSLPLLPRIQVAFGIAVSIAILLGLFQIIDRILSNIDVHSVWMPRYLGFIAPAVTIATAALLIRLPFTPLRWSIIGLLLAANLIQAAAHIFVHSEPVVDKMAADVITAMRSNNTVLAFTPNTSPSIGPNTAGSIVDWVGGYYLIILSDNKIAPLDFWRWGSTEDYFPIRQQSDSSTVSAAAADDPQARTLLVWDGIEIDQTPAQEDMLPRLGKQWHQESEDLYPVRCFWDWGQLYTNRRRVYVRN
jgi:MFS family permease